MASHIDTLFCYICTAVDMDTAKFKGVISSARKFYESHDIRGLLLYDGSYFIHFIVGTHDYIELAHARLNDTVHAYDSEILFKGNTSDICEEFAGWHLGFLDTEEHYPHLDRLRQATGNADSLKSIFLEYKKMPHVR